MCYIHGMQVCECIFLVCLPVLELLCSFFEVRQKRLRYLILNWLLYSFRFLLQLLILKNLRYNCPLHIFLNFF